MKKAAYPITPAVRYLREHTIAFTPHLYDYIEHGGTAHSAACLGVDEHRVIKTIILTDEAKKGLVMLMYGDCEISTRNLARQIGARHIEPAAPAQAQRMTGYLIGGTSPFGLKTPLPVYVQAGIMALDSLYINGGKRGFLVNIRGADLAVLQPTVVDAAA